MLQPWNKTEQLETCGICNKISTKAFWSWIHNAVEYKFASSKGLSCNLSPSCVFLVPLLHLNLQNEGSVCDPEILFLLWNSQHVELVDRSCTNMSILSVTMSIPVCILEPGNNQRMDSGTLWTHSEMGLSYNSMITQPPWAPTPTGGPQWHFGSPGISISSEPVSPLKSDYLLSPSGLLP